MAIEEKPPVSALCQLLPAADMPLQGLGPTLQLGLDFASKLDRAVLRSAKVKLVARVIEERPKPSPTVEIKPHLPTVPDRRYRRF
jgi:hypothetical protein